MYSITVNATEYSIHNIQGKTRYVAIFVVVTKITYFTRSFTAQTDTEINYETGGQVQQETTERKEDEWIENDGD